MSWGNVSAKEGKLEFDKAESPFRGLSEPDGKPDSEVNFLQERDQSLRLVGREFTANISFEF